MTRDDTICVDQPSWWCREWYSCCWKRRSTAQPLTYYSCCLTTPGFHVVSIQCSPLVIMLQFRSAIALACSSHQPHFIRIWTNASGRHRKSVNPAWKNWKWRKCLRSKLWLYLSNWAKQLYQGSMSFFPVGNFDNLAELTHILHTGTSSSMMEFLFFQQIPPWKLKEPCSQAPYTPPLHFAG